MACCDGNLKFVLRTTIRCLIAGKTMMVRVDTVSDRRPART